jgi:uncharacterized membrane protein YeaQ/YmgE (transglycosylase-associated protein family)
MQIITCLLVGLLVGSLASLVKGWSRFSLPSHVLLGTLGALVGGWLVDELGLQPQLSGIVAVIAVALFGAVAVLGTVRFFSYVTVDRR